MSPRPPELRWESLRSSRGRDFVGDEEVRRIALVINELIDLPYWSEEQEQELLECATSTCVEAIAGALPPPFFDVLHTEVGLEDKEAQQLGDSLVSLCRSDCRLPFLDEQDRRRVVRGVVFTIVAAMEEGRDLAGFLANIQDGSAAQEIIVNVFMQGALDVFFEEDLRKKLASSMASLVKEVPLVPDSAVEGGIERLLGRLTGSLQEALQKSFREYRAACFEHRELPMGPPELDSERERERVLALYEDRPFLIQLRRVLVEQVLDDCFGNAFCRAALLKWRVWALTRFVDLIFGHLPGVEKIEQSVQVFRTSVVLSSADMPVAPERQEEQNEQCEQDARVDAVPGVSPT